MKLARKARLRFDRHEGRYMIVYPERGLVLNASGAEIAKKLDGSRTREQIASELATEHGADPEDVNAFIDELAAKGLVEE